MTLETYTHTLKSKNSHFSEVRVWKFFIQITMGLHHLHSRDILHRDLKTLNIFLTKDFVVKIGDLGEATGTINNETDGGKPFLI